MEQDVTDPADIALLDQGGYHQYVLIHGLGARNVKKTGRHLTPIMQLYARLCHSKPKLYARVMTTTGYKWKRIA